MNKKKITIILSTLAISMASSFHLSAMMAGDVDEEFTAITTATATIRQRVTDLTAENHNLRQNLTAVDTLVGSIFSGEITPTTFNFLRAVYQRQPETQLQSLFAAATSREEIRDIIVGGHTKFRATVPGANRRVLELTGLLGNLQITTDLETIKYGMVSFPGSPPDAIDAARAAVASVKDRLSPVRQPTLQEDSEDEDEDEKK